MWLVWLLIVLGGTWVVAKIEELMERHYEKKRNEEIHRMLVRDIERSLNDIHSDNTGESGQHQ